MKRLLVICIFLFGNLGLASDAASPEGADRDSQKLERLLQILQDSDRGAKLILAAKSHWSLSTLAAFSNRVYWSNISKTDRTVILEVSAASPTRSPAKMNTTSEVQETYVHLRETGTLEEMILDLAHELTHAVYEVAWDPMSPELGAEEYIEKVLEGAGGEVEAMVYQCQVALELYAKGTFSKIPKSCKSYVNVTEGTIERHKIEEDFYRVGSWKEKLKEASGNPLFLDKKLSSRSPVWNSSVGGRPYPVVLYEEYLDLNERVCRSLFQGRQPAESSVRLGNRCSPAVRGKKVTL